MKALWDVEFGGACLLHTVSVIARSVDVAIAKARKAELKRTHTGRRGLPGIRSVKLVRWVEG